MHRTQEEGEEIQEMLLGLSNIKYVWKGHPLFCLSTNILYTMCLVLCMQQRKSSEQGGSQLVPMPTM
jgi:hypothetical protein